MAGNLAKIAFAAASTPTLLPTSQHTDKAWTPFFATTAAVASAACASTSTQATAAPASPKAREIARPIPLPAPVTTADFPASEYLLVVAINCSYETATVAIRPRYAS